MLKRITIVLMLLILPSAVSVADDAETSVKAKLSILVSIAPHAFLVDELSGGHIDVAFLLKPGENPVTFQPTMKQVAAFSKAVAYVSVGLPFEIRLLEKIRPNFPELLIIDSGEGIARRCIASHRHGASDHHDDALDPHIWLSPPLLVSQARNIAKALKQIDPEHAQEYASNLDALVTKINRMHAAIDEKLIHLRGKTFYVYHPAFGYFADAYGLEQEAVETGGKSPTPKQLARLIRSAKKEGVRVVFVQKQFDSRSAQTVASSIGGSVVPLDPMTYDVLDSIEFMAEEIEKALSK